MPITFVWPAMLGTLLVLAPVGAMYIWALRRRRAVAARHAGFGIVQAPRGGGPGWRRAVPPALYLAALALLGVAAARPQATVAMPRLEGTVLLVFDVSGSMAATDVEPTRLGAAVAAAKELLLQRPPAARIGVVAFSDGGLAVQRPTTDEEIVLAAIERLAPQRGTAVGEGLLAALRILAAGEQSGADGAPVEQESLGSPRATPATIVVFSDGENNGPPSPLDVAQAAAELGVRIHTVGVGSAAGATLQLDGFSVHSRLDEGALRAVSEVTGGSYFGASDSGSLAAVYEELATRAVVREEFTEVTALVGGAGLLLLLLGGLCSFLWFNRLA